MESGRIVRKIANFQSSRTFVSMIKSIIEVSKKRLSVSLLSIAIHTHTFCLRIGMRKN